MSPEEVFGLPYILTEIRETKDALKSKVFSHKDVSAISMDFEVFSPNGFCLIDLATILTPLNIYMTKIAFA